MADPAEKVYEIAPEGTMVKIYPAQIVPLFTETMGEAITVTFEIAATDELHPDAIVPVTEYAEFTDGITVLLPDE